MLTTPRRGPARSHHWVAVFLALPALAVSFAAGSVLTDDADAAATTENAPESLDERGEADSEDKHSCGPSVGAVDSGNGRLQKFDDARVFANSWDSVAARDARRTVPVGIAIDDSRSVYVGDPPNHRIEKFGTLAAFPWT